MLIADSIVLNSDRHFGNFGFIIDNDTFESVSMSLVFDFNLAFLPYVELDNFEYHISKSSPRLGNDYIRVARELMIDDIRSDLRDLRYSDLFIETDDEFTPERLKIINQLKDKQINRILRESVSYSFLN